MVIELQSFINFEVQLCAMSLFDDRTNDGLFYILNLLFISFSWEANPSNKLA